MKKRMLYLGVVIVLAFSITACGNKSDIKESSSQNKKQQEETKQEGQEKGAQEDEMLISEETAKTIALNFAEVSEFDAEEVKTELTKENDTDIYLVGFHVADKEYSVKINAATGEALDSGGQEETAPQEEEQPVVSESEENGEGQPE